MYAGLIVNFSNNSAWAIIKNKDLIDKIVWNMESFSLKLCEFKSRYQHQNIEN